MNNKFQTVVYVSKNSLLLFPFQIKIKIYAAHLEAVILKII